MDNKILFGIMTIIFNSIGVPCFMQGRVGKGILRIVLGVVTCGVIGVINDGMTMCGVSEFWQKVIRGLVIILAVVIDQTQRNLEAKMALQARNENK